MRRTTHRRARGDEGAVLVESAFVLPVFLLFVFGIIEFGLFFAASATTTSTTRDGARFASTSFGVNGDKTAAANAIRDIVVKDVKARTNLDLPVRLWVYKANANGFPDTRTDFSGCTTNCYQYTWNASTATFDLVGGATPPNPWSTPDACLSGSATPSGLESIGVYLEVRHTYVTKMLNPILGSTALIAEKTVSQLEPLPVAQCP